MRSVGLADGQLHRAKKALTTLTNRYERLSSKGSPKAGRAHKAMEQAKELVAGAQKLADRVNNKFNTEKGWLTHEAEQRRKANHYPLYLD